MKQHNNNFIIKLWHTTQNVEKKNKMFSILFYRFGKFVSKIAHMHRAQKFADEKQTNTFGICVSFYILVFL